MNQKRIGEFFERVAKMDPKPVITITQRRLGKDKKTFYLSKHTGVFRWWNGQEASFGMRKSITRKKGVAYLFMPFHIEDIVSARITTEQELIDDRNFLFELLERIKEKERSKKK